MAAEMNFAGLQARVVPLVAELFATLAAQNPLRMHFADIAGKTLLDIVDNLRDTGISQEAIAASLGLTITGYRAKMRRLRAAHRAGAERAEDEPRTLLERVYAFIDDADEPISEGQVLTHFRGVKIDSIRGVLQFLVRSGVLHRVNLRGERRYQASAQLETGQPTRGDVAVLLYRDGPLSVSEAAQRLEMPLDQCSHFISELEADGRLERSLRGTESVWTATGYHIPLDASEGYEAAIWDHLAAVIRAICKKLRLGRHGASLPDKTGGATFTFRIPEDHPLYDEVSNHLAENRVKFEGWLKRAEAIDYSAHAAAREVTVYVGQLVERCEDE